LWAAARSNQKLSEPVVSRSNWKLSELIAARSDRKLFKLIVARSDRQLFEPIAARVAGSYLGADYGQKQLETVWPIVGCSQKRLEIWSLNCSSARSNWNSWWLLVKNLGGFVWQPPAQLGLQRLPL